MSAGYMSLRPKPDGSHVIEQHDTPSTDLPNLMVHGFQSVKSDLSQTHPLEFSEKHWEENRSQLDMVMLRNVQGLHAPLRLQMERQTAQQIQRLPGMSSSSNLMMNTLTGRLDGLDFDDVLNNPTDGEVMGQPHAMAEKQLHLL